MPLFFDAFTRFGPRPRLHGRHPYSLQHLVDELEHCSISGALVSSTACHVYDPMLENRRLCQTLAGHDHLFPIWHVMPHWTAEFPEPAELSKLLQEHNVRAVTLSPKTAGWNLLSRTSEPLLAELQRTRTLCILDAGDDVDIADVEKLADQFPTLPLLLRNLWWSKQRLTFPLLLTQKNVHLCFDACQSNYAIEFLVEHGCEDQLLFASNATMMAAGAHRFYVDYADISPEAKAKVASGNLIRLLHGLKPPREKINQNEDAIMAEARQGKPLSATVYDIHAHILDEGCNGAGGAYTMYRGGPKGTVELAKRMGVDAIGLMSWNGTVGAHAELGNQCVKDALDAAPGTWWGLGTFDVAHESAETMVAQMEKLYADRRFLGLKPYPTYGMPYDDKRYDCWWEFGNRRHLYCLLHPVKWFQAAEFESICSRFPNLTVIAAHCGASYETADTAIALAKKFPNFYAEVTLTPVCLGIIDYLVAGCGADRVLYGSDLPMRDPRPQLGWVVYSRLPLEQKQMVLGLNSKRIVETVRAHQEQALGSAVR